jgi:hypothetical protein
MLTRTAGLVAAAIAGATAIAYVILIVGQGDPDVGAVILVVAIISGGAIAAGVGATTADPRIRRLALGAASGTLLSLGALSIFSIGLVLLIAGLAVTLAWARSLAGGGPGTLPAMIAFLVGAAVPFVLFLV